MVYCGRQCEEENKKLNIQQKTEAPTMFRPALKQPEKNAQRDPGEK